MSRRYGAAASLKLGLGTRCARVCLAITLLALGQGVSSDTVDPTGVAPAAQVTFDLSKGHTMADKLWGIFFEEVGTCL